MSLILKAICGAFAHDGDRTGFEKYRRLIVTVTSIAVALVLLSMLGLWLLR